MVQAEQEQRSLAKRSNQRLNRIIQARGGSCYAEVARLNSLGVTGSLPHELRERRGVKSTRDGLSAAELAALILEEELEASAILERGLYGDRAILGLVRDVSLDVAALRVKYGTGALGAPTLEAHAAPGPEGA